MPRAPSPTHRHMDDEAARDETNEMKQERRGDRRETEKRKAKQEANEVEADREGKTETSGFSSSACSFKPAGPTPSPDAASQRGRAAEEAKK